MDVNAHKDDGIPGRRMRSKMDGGPAHSPVTKRVRVRIGTAGGRGAVSPDADLR